MTIIKRLKCLTGTYLAGISSVTLFSGYLSPSLAAEDLGLVRLEEVIVTATKRAANVQDIPVAISAFSPETLAKRGITKTQDLAGKIANVVVKSTFSNAQPNFTIRGVGVANEFNPNIASPIGFYVDENYQSFRPAGGQQIYDLERIEVVKGPQGTLYGRNTTGGAINIITRKPELGDDNGFLEVGYSRYNRRKLAGAYETTLVEEQLGIRASGIVEKGDGWQKNRNPDARTDEDYNAVDRFSGRVNIRFKPQDDMNLYLKVHGAKDNPTGAAVTAPTPLGTDFFGFSRDGLDDDEYTVNTLGEYLVTTVGAQVTFEWDLGNDLSFTSISAYDRSRYKNETDCDGSPFTSCSADYDSKSELFNQDLRLSYLTDKFSLIGGLYYGWDSIENDPVFCIYCVPSALSGFNPPIFTPDAIAAGLLDPTQPLTALIAESHFDQERESYAIYAEGAYDVTDKLSLTLGLRFTYDDFLYENGRTVLFDSTGTARATSVPLTFPIDLSVPGIEVKDSYERITGRLIADYHLTSEVMLYASYSRGYRAGSFNGLSYLDESQIYLVDPETLQAYEIGAKTQFWDDRLQINAAVFYYDYGNQQTQTCEGSICSLGGADAEVVGLDMDITAQLSDTLKATLSFGMLDTEYDEGEVISRRPVGGNPIPYSPEVSGNLGIDWLIADTELGELSWYVETQYNGEMYYEPFDGVTRVGSIQKETGYWLVNTHISLINDTYSISLWGKNLSDKLYFPHGSDQTAFIGSEYYMRGEPRTYGVELKVNF